MPPDCASAGSSSAGTPPVTGTPPVAGASPVGMPPVRGELPTGRTGRSDGPTPAAGVPGGGRLTPLGSEVAEDEPVTTEIVPVGPATGRCGRPRSGSPAAGVLGSIGSTGSPAPRR